MGFITTKEAVLRGTEIHELKERIAALERENKELRALLSKAPGMMQDYRLSSNISKAQHDQMRHFEADVLDYLARSAAKKEGGG